jgi:microsomal dipeptidase-like Zn-dependent dipeptidase
MSGHQNIGIGNDFLRLMITFKDIESIDYCIQNVLAKAEEHYLSIKIYINEHLEDFDSLNALRIFSGISSNANTITEDYEDSELLNYYI